jgi:hypothetical protein
LRDRFHGKGEGTVERVRKNLVDPETFIATLEQFLPPLPARLGASRLN